ncbi:MAG: AI-2E family transporter [Armatimonadetes bacterium]|nr:AI-2E family transporter [Armatimonadota bacterium]
MRYDDRVLRLAGGIAVLLVLYFLRTVVVDVLVALALACLINPVADRITGRLRWPRGATVSAMALGLAVLLGGISYLAAPVIGDGIRSLAARAPVSALSLERMLAGDVNVESPLGDGVYRKVRARVEKSVVDLLDRSAAALVGFASHLHHIVVIPILVFYLVKDAPLIRERLYALLPARYRGQGVVLACNCYRALSGYVYGQLALSAIAGVLTTAGLLVLGVPHALILGMGSGIVEAVPYLGPMAAGAVAALIALPRGPDLVLKVIALYVLVRMLIDLVIGPRVLGRALHLHPLTVLVTLLVGGQLLGILGFFIAAPVAAMATAVLGQLFGRPGDGRCAGVDEAEQPAA